MHRKGGEEIETKLSTAEMIQRLLSLDSTLTYRELGSYSGVSPQRAKQIVDKYALHKTGRWSQTSRLCHGGCGQWLRYKSNKSGWCRQCRRRSHSYEYRCAWCGQVRVVSGKLASTRRANNRRVKVNPSLDFCSKRCAGKYFSKKHTHKGVN
jgi:hypothetical protein